MTDTTTTVGSTTATSPVSRVTGADGSAPAAQKRAFIKSYGCQMNVYDAGRMADVLAPEGYGVAETADEADLVILNTCHIREKASEKVYSELGKLRLLKRERRAAGRDLTIAVAGCVAQAEGAEIVARQPAVDLVVGPQAYHRLPDLLARAKAAGRAIDTEFPEEDKFDHLPLPPRQVLATRGPTAFVTVQEGCDKFCTFCVVPYTRGAEVSRPAAKVLDEVRRHAEAGVIEVTLIGQNVNAYHGAGADGRDWTLARLLHAVAEVPGIRRIRYTTSHPRDMDDALIEAHRDLPALMPYLHLPVQAGADRILKAMNRKHTHAEYRAIIDRVRRARPDLALSSDFIVGFPGESDADFADTMRLVADIGFASAFSFKYSARPGTPAAERDGQVAEAAKTERLARLQALLLAQQTAFNRATVGRTVDVLFEKNGRHPGQIVGKSPYLQAVHAAGPPALIGQVVPVTITAIASNSLAGRIAGPLSEAHATEEVTA